MKFKELQSKSLQELQNMLKDLNLSLGKARFDLANNTLKDFSVIKKTKKDIARTLLAIKNLQKSK